MAAEEVVTLDSDLDESSSTVAVLPKSSSSKRSPVWAYFSPNPDNARKD